MNKTINVIIVLPGKQCEKTIDNAVKLIKRAYKEKRYGKRNSI